MYSFYKFNTGTKGRTIVNQAPHTIKLMIKFHWIKYIEEFHRKKGFLTSFKNLILILDKNLKT